ncbi:MAG: MFS transporter [Gluconacetobacter diazotrophicus]|nr:MFS transporter [Gluconacetobacter diazotrophicus]
MFGNLLEVFDFIAYGTFAVPIGRAFFPAHDPYTSVLLSVATFGVGFVTRPFGALVVGLLADRSGRRAGMLVSLALMGLGSLLIAVLPSYRVLGPLAPLLLVLARMIQGIAWGAEVGPTTAFLLETAPPGREGLRASWQSASQMLAVLAAGLLGLGADRILGDAALSAWAWRIPFALGVLVLPVGFLLRRNLPDPPRPPVPSVPPSSRLRLLGVAGSLPLFCAFVVVTAGTVSQYFVNYVTTYALSVLHMPPALALAGTVVAGVCGLFAALLGGVLSDRTGRVGIVVLPRLLLGLLILPLLWWLRAAPTAPVFVLVVAIVSALQVSAFAGAVVLLLELFPPAIRSTGFGLLYAGAVSLFGGTAQIVFTWAIHATGDPAAPAWYLAAVNLLCVPAGLVLARNRRSISVVEHPA